jgi:hypothetical protein
VPSYSLFKTVWKVFEAAVRELSAMSKEVLVELVLQVIAMGNFYSKFPSLYTGERSTNSHTWE